MKKHKLPILNILIVRPRLMLAMLSAAVLYFLLPDDWRMTTRLLSAWDFGTGLFLIMTAIMMTRADNKAMRYRASVQDEGGLIILGLTVLDALASLVAIMRELAVAKSLPDHSQAPAIILVAITVMLSWFFMQTIFALHYAHAYYSADGKNGDGGLEFPAKYTTPDYWDFVYFSFIIGTAAQTADINLTSRSIRRVVTLQCVTVFFFNTTILALAINVGASLL